MIIFNKKILSLTLFLSSAPAFADNNTHIATRKEIEVFVQKALSRLEQEAKATRPDGNPVLLHKTYKHLHSILSSGKEEVINILLDQDVTNKQLANIYFLESFLEGCLESFLEDNSTN